MGYLWQRILQRWRIVRMHDPADSLSEAIDAAVANPAWKSRPDGTTFCNYFCQEILHAAGCKDLDDLDARDMGLKVLNEIARAGDGFCAWLEITASKAVELAKAGKFVLGWAPIMNEAHGHVVIVAPEDMEQSGTFGRSVPMC